MADPAKNSDLHGSAPDSSDVVLVLVDVINHLEFEGSERFVDRAIATATRIASLRKRAKSAGVPVVYVNDNFGKWRSSLDDIVDHCLHDGVPGEPIVRLLVPDEDDYCVIKPKHSGFFATTLETLLQYLHAKTLVLAGFTADRCLLFTASDAYMRDYVLFIPEDCTASIAPEDAPPAIHWMKKALGADVRPSTEIVWSELTRGSRAGGPSPGGA